MSAYSHKRTFEHPATSIGAIPLDCYDSSWGLPVSEAGVERKLTPLSQSGGSVLLEDISAVEMAVLIEVVVYRGVNGSKLLQGLDVPEFRHRALSSSKGLV